MLGRLKDLTINRDQSQNITITISSDCRELFDKLKDENINVEIKKASKHRSMDANNYFWHLCGEIAKASSKYSIDGKNEVYREAIKAKGEWQDVLVWEEAVDTFIKKWGEKGTGWFAEVIDNYYEPVDDFVIDDAPKKRKIVHVYFGSSTYDTLSMSRIIDFVVNIANDLGIPTMTETDKQKMLISWGKRTENKNE